MSQTDYQRLDARELPGRTTALALFVVVLAVLAPFMHHRGGQQLSRYALTAAVWDQGTVELTHYSDLFFRDGAARDGVIYSDKAPGQPLLAVPYYGVYRILGGGGLSSETLEPDLGLWWLTLWSAGIPAALLAILMYRWASEIEPRTALAATLTMALGTLLLVYGALLFAHVLAGLLGFAMFLLTRKLEASTARLLAAGALGGLAVLSEYPVALVVGIVAVAAWFVHRRRVWAVVVGGAPFAILLGIYNWQLFGGPFVFSYQWNVFSGIRDEAAETLEIFTGPSIERIVHVLFSERGLLIATPVIVMAVIGLGLMWRRGWRLDAIVAALAFLSMLSIQFAWGSSYAGGAGPRYVIPGLPFLVGPLALAWKRWRLVTTALAIIGVITVMSAIVTIPQLGSDLGAGLGDWVKTLLGGTVAPTLYTEAIGPWGWLIHLLTVGVALGWLFKAARSDGPDSIDSRLVPRDLPDLV